VVVTVGPLKGLDGHAEKAGGGPKIASGLHEPGRGRVPQSMGRRGGVETGERDGMLERCLHGFHRLAVEFDEVVANQTAAMPAAQVSQQARRKRNCWLTLVGWGLTDR